MQQAAIISRYESRNGKHYAELTYSSDFGYGYSTRHSGGGYGINATREEALAGFRRVLRAEPVELIHKKGEDMGNLWEGAPGKPISTAEVKRRFSLGSRWQKQSHLSSSGYNPDPLPTTQTVELVQTQSIRFNTGSWLEFPAAQRLRELESGAIVLLDYHEPRPMLTYTPAE